VPQYAHLLIGQILVDRHQVASEAVDAGLRQQDQEERDRGETRFLGEILVERKVVTSEQVGEALAWQREQFAQALVGPYRMESLLGHGGAGTVYRAVRLGGKKDGPAIALKLLPQKKPGDVDALARFQREAQAGVNLDHPHIVRTLDFGTTRDCYYLVCELMPGGTLSDRVRMQGPLAEADGLALCVAMLQALDHASARGLMHRDIKPANILYDAQGNPRLADMGLAQAMGGNLAGPRDRTAGTPAFIAPEQAMGQDNSDVRADLYSLGATIFFAFTGAPPFVGKKPIDVINQHLHEKPPEVNEVNRAIGSTAAALVRKLMAKRAEDRYRNAAEAISDVRRIQAGERPLAMALTIEQAYAPLKAQVQLRDNGTAELSPSSTGKSPTPNNASTLTPKSNKVQQTRPAGSRSQDVGRLAKDVPPARGGPSAARKEPTTDKTRRKAAVAKDNEAPGRGAKADKAEKGAASKVRPATSAGKPWGLIIAAGVIVVGLGVVVVMLLMREPPAPPKPAPVVEAPAPEPTGTVIDLLSKLKANELQKKDWMMRDGVLMSPRGAQHLLPLPWLPPVEYDLTCSFKRLYPSGSLSLLVDIAGRQCALVITGDTDLRIGFETIGGRPMGENGTLHVVPEPLAPDKRLTVTVQVRRNGLSARIGEQDICQVTSGLATVGLDEIWSLPKGHVLGLGTRTTQVAIFRLNLTERSGSGSPVATK
jgi:serine/threonine protein kinase